MREINKISEDLFDKIRSRFTNLELGDENGAVVTDPADARFFDFDFVLEGSNLGRVSISINDAGSLKVYYSQGITENQDDQVKKEWFAFLREMRMFSMRRLLRFDTRDIAKSNLDKNDFQHLAQVQGTKEPEDMTNMNESKWSQKSSKKTSRAVKGATEVIVRHARAVDEMFPGARSQRKNIKAIFIQNKDGERFKYPFIHPAGAFAMAQHVDHGGIPHDPAGKAIITMSEQIAQLQAQIDALKA
jgi:3-oxoacyl-[acyl-carrier-protein] synthase III